MKGKPGTSKNVAENSPEVDITQENKPEGKGEEAKEQIEDKNPTIILRSHKMKELKDLLLSEKLNTQAISLHLTAQSQVQVNKKGRNDLDNVRPKRARRE